jgi:SAM-dependent methyltransferase
VNRLRPPAFAHAEFVKHQDRLRALPLQEIFTDIASRNLWGSSESVSGLGSTIDATKRLRTDLPHLIERYRITRLLDIPCGDFAWMGYINLGACQYIGADIVPALVERNRLLHQRDSEGPLFLHLDITKDHLPRVDLVICRDCLVHLSFRNIFRAFSNLRRSGSQYVLMTTFFNHERNEDIPDGDWRLLSLQQSPFSLSPPEELIVEECVEGEGAFGDKALGLWRIADLPSEMG